jgi:hypothetical protein
MCDACVDAVDCVGDCGSEGTRFAHSDRSAGAVRLSWEHESDLETGNRRPYFFKGFSVQGQLALFSFPQLFIRLLPPEANRSAKHGFSSSIDDIALVVFEKIIVIFLLEMNLAF